MTIIGYAIVGEDNDTTMLDECEFETCSVCGYVTDVDFYNDQHSPKKAFLDYSVTYDSFTIVSAKFRDFCLRQGYGGLRFRRFRGTNRHFCFNVDEPVIEFDAARSGTEFDRFCPACGFFESVTGAIPVFLKKPEQLPADGFARTDLCFGSGNEKKPIYLIGAETHRKMRKERFRGIEFIAIKI